MHVSGYFVLALWITHYFLVFQHEPFALSAFIGEEFVMRSGAAKSAFLCPVGSAGIGAMFEVVAYFVETFFRHKVFAFGTEIAAVDDGVDEVVWMGAEVAAGFYTADAFEAESVPDAT